MRSPILTADIKIILHLFAPKQFNAFVFDPDCRMKQVESLSRYESEDAPNILINFSKCVESIRGYSIEEFDMVFHFGGGQLNLDFERSDFKVIQRRDGQMRWLYQKNIQSILNTYNVCSKRSLAFSWLVKGIQKLGLDRLLVGTSLSIYSKKAHKLESLFEDLVYDSYTVFMGTAGYDRTPVISLQNKGEATHYVKFASNMHTMYRINNERQFIRRLKHKEPNTFMLPELCQEMDRTLMLTKAFDVKNSKLNPEFGTMHQKVLRELIKLSPIQIQPIWKTAFWNDILDNLSYLKRRQLSDQMKRVLLLLNQTREEINNNEKIATSIAHGDFTPWNLRINGRKAVLYDWELAKCDAPLLFDLFHFNFQTEIFLKKANTSRLFDQIFKCADMGRIRYLIDTYKIDIDLHIKLYLLYTISYYGRCFQLQEKTTADQLRQLAVWEKALTSILKFESSQSHRSRFIEEFNDKLATLPHAFLKFKEAGLSELADSSDLDIAISVNAIPEVINFCSQHRLIVKKKVLKKSFMSVLQLFFRDGSYLSIDLIHQFKRKSMQMMETETLLKSAKKDLKKGVFVPHLKFDLEYAMLFYYLNNASIPTKYEMHYLNLPEGVKEEVLDYIHAKYRIELDSLEALFRPDKLLSQALKLHLQLNQTFWPGIKNKIAYLKDTLLEIWRGKGEIITFSGVDGAGKSTIIEKVKTTLENQYRKEVVVLRHRPGILPIISAIKHGGRKKAEKAASERLPRQGKNNSLISSLLRFAYYYTDYMVGQVYIYFKYVLRGKTVVFDRYYFDFINDSKRSNIKLNKRFLRSLYSFILKPKLNIHLSASPRLIRQRKQELDIETIHFLDRDYRTLFEYYNKKYKNSHYFTITNIKLKDTVDSIMHEYSRIA